MLSKKYIVPMHLIIGIRGKYRQPRIVKKYPFSLFFERFDASHVHCIFIVTIVEWVRVVSISRRRDRAARFRLRVVITLLRASIRRGTVHFNYKIYQVIISIFYPLLHINHYHPLSSIYSLVN